MEETTTKLAPKKKIWKLREGSVRRNFRSYVKELRGHSDAVLSVEGCWKILKGALPEAINRTFGWTKSKLDIEKHGGDDSVHDC